VANLNGNLNFNLNNTRAYHQGDLPENHLGDASYQPLLTIKAPANGQNMVDLQNSAITLSHFEVGTELTPGDRFYLIEVDNNVTNDPANQAFTAADPVSQTTSAIQGVTVQYDFEIDKNLDNLGSEENSRFLVARLTGVTSPSVTEPITDGRTGGTSFLQRSHDWLSGSAFPLFPSDCYRGTTCCDPDDPDYPNCNCDTCEDSTEGRDSRRVPCNPCNPRETSEAKDSSDWCWTPFADVKVSRYGIDTRSDSHFKVQGVHYLGGLAAQRRLDNSRIALGIFLDGGNGRYDTTNNLSNPVPSLPSRVKGRGDIDTYGGGIFFREKWDNGFHVDALLRAGALNNRFSSRDLLPGGEKVSYKLDSTYDQGREPARGNRDRQYRHRL
jgi:hypothetical protein